LSQVISLNIISEEISPVTSTEGLKPFSLRNLPIFAEPAQTATGPAGVSEVTEGENWGAVFPDYVAELFYTVKRAILRTLQQKSPGSGPLKVLAVRIMPNFYPVLFYK